MLMSSSFARADNLGSVITLTLIPLFLFSLQADPPYLQRAKAFKSELFDSAGVEEKLMKKENEFMDLKKNMKLKVSTQL